MRNNETASTLVRTVAAYRNHSLVDNRIHCRYEVTDASAVPVLEALMAEGVVDLLSVMDHSPGQGQFKTLDAYLSYMMGNHGMSREEAVDAAKKKTAQIEGAHERVQRLLAQAHRLQIPTASHDDDSPQRIAAMHALGVRMSEFPINVETAQAAADHALRPSSVRPTCCAARARAARCVRSTPSTQRRPYPVLGLPAVDADRSRFRRSPTGGAAAQ